MPFISDGNLSGTHRTRTALTARAHGSCGGGRPRYTTADHHERVGPTTLSACLAQAGKNENAVSAADGITLPGW